MTAVHFLSNHSRRESREKQNERYTCMSLKKGKKIKKVARVHPYVHPQPHTHTHTYSLSLSFSLLFPLICIDRRKKKEKGKHLKCCANARIISLRIYLVASLDWSAGRKLIDELYCLFTVLCFPFFVPMCLIVHTRKIVILRRSL